MRRCSWVLLLSCACSGRTGFEPAGSSVDLSCSLNSECPIVCIAGRCSDTSGIGQPCDDYQDCSGSLSCRSSACVDLTTVDCSTDPGGTACDDANPCTVDDVCDGSGSCAGSAYSCDDGNPCTDDTCDGLGACIRVDNTATCDDGLYCTHTDACIGGACRGAGTPCTGTQVCDETTDACVGVCRTSTDCDDGNPCTDEQCLSGICYYHANSAPCDDGYFCTATDGCVNGRCAGTGSSCPAGQVCAEAADTCHSCLTDLDCDNGTFCDGIERCVAGTCASAEGSPCASACDEANDRCKAGPCFSDAACDDGVACTADACDGFLPVSEQIAWSNRAMNALITAGEPDWTRDSVTTGANSSGGAADVIYSPDATTQLTLSLDLQSTRSASYRLWVAHSRISAVSGGACDTTLGLYVNGSLVGSQVENTDDAFAWHFFGTRSLTGAGHTLGFSCSNTCASRRCAIDGVVVTTNSTVDPSTDAAFVPYASADWDAGALDAYDDGAGICTHTPREASCARSVCEVATCHPATGCSTQLAGFGTSCRSATVNECTGADFCDGSGVCLSADSPPGVLCADLNDTVVCDRPDICDGSGTCDTNLAADGVVCDDGDDCASVDACVGGVCTAGATDKDSDGDGYFDQECPGGTDCDSTQPGIHPNGEGVHVPGTCTDTIDNDCDQVVDGSDPGCITTPLCNGPYCWRGAGPTTQHLRAIHGQRGTVAVVGDHGVALIYDGTSWAGTDTGTDVPLSDVWVNRADDIWAVGGGGTIVRWNGTGWLAPGADASTTSGTISALNSVYGFADNDVWAVATLETLRWNGVAWSPTGTGGGKVVFGVAPDDVWVIGTQRKRWTGTWTQYGCVEADCAYGGPGLWGAASNDIWHNVGLSHSHFDGAGWTTSPGAVIPGRMWGTGPDDIWEVGSSGILHYTAAGWTSVPADASGTLYDIWVGTTTEGWAVGWEGALVHFDGAEWREAGLQDAAIHTARLNATWMASTTSAFAVGDGGASWQLANGSWQARITGATENLHDVYAPSSDEAWAVGDAGVVLHWTAGAWAKPAKEPSGTLRTTWGSGPNDIWFLGDDGAIFRWNGTAIAAVTSPTTDAFYSMWGFGPDEVYAATFTDGAPDIYAWRGSAWALHSTVTGFCQSVCLPSSGVLPLAMGGVSGSDLWLVGRDGFRAAGAHWNGSFWAKQLPVGYAYGVWAAATDRVYVTFDGGNFGSAVDGLVMWDGTQWVSPDVNLSVGLRDIHGANADVMTLVGVRGTLIDFRP